MRDVDMNIDRIQPNDLRGYFKSELERAPEFQIRTEQGWQHMRAVYAVTVKRWTETLSDDQCRAIVNWIKRHPKPDTWQGGALSWIYEEMPFRFGLWRWWKP